MFRTAILRSALAARYALRPITSNASSQLPIASRPSVVTAKSFTWAAARCYSTAGGLQKQEVEGRIMALLKGFDKVRLKNTHENILASPSRTGNRFSILDTQGFQMPSQLAIGGFS
jgi:hypothetical protein